MLRTQCLPVFLFFLLFLLPAARAQRTAIAIVSGISTAPYEFPAPVVYSNTVPIWVWSGRYHRTGFLMGIDLHRAITTHWQFKAGIRLQVLNMSQQTDLQWPSETDGNGNYVPTLPDDRLTMSHLYLEIPLRARYMMLPGKRVTPYLETGFATHYYLTTGIGQRLEGSTDQQTLRIKEVHPLHLSLLLAAGIQCHLSERHQLFMQIGLQYLSDSVDKVSEKNGLTLGLETGWRIQLKQHTK